MIVSGSNSYSARKKRRLDVNVIQATEFLSCLTATSRKFLRSISQYAGIMLDVLTKAYVATSCQHNLSDRHNLSESGRSTFAGKSVLLPSDVINFAMPPSQRLTGNRFKIGYHVTPK